MKFNIMNFIRGLVVVCMFFIAFIIDRIECMSAFGCHLLRFGLLCFCFARVAFDILTMTCFSLASLWPALLCFYLACSALFLFCLALSLACVALLCFALLGFGLRVALLCFASLWLALLLLRFVVFYLLLHCFALA